jgi:hypothetical protein
MANASAALAAGAAANVTTTAAIPAKLLKRMLILPVERQW